MNKQHFLDKVTKRVSDALDRYNYDLLPQSFKGTDKLTIVCKKHGEFSQQAYSHIFSSGCPKCGKESSEQNRQPTTDSFVNKARLKFGDKFDYKKSNYVSKYTELTITCPNHGDFQIRPVQHLWSIHGCPKCDFEIPRIKRKQDILDTARKIYGNKYDYSKVVYVNQNDPVEIVCPSHGSFLQSLFTHIRTKIGCPKCALDADRISMEDFIKRSREVHGDKYEYKKVKLSGIGSHVTITCKKHGDWNQRAGSHLAGNGCKQCFIEDNRSTADEFIKASRLIHGDKYDYSKVIYTGNKNPVEIICSVHGSFWQKPNNHISNTNGCPFCSESKGERAVEEVLKKYGINFVREYRIIPYRYRYDFYLPEFNIFIEFNGTQHYKAVDLFGGKEALLRTKERDREKRILVDKRNGALIVIPYQFLAEKSVEAILVRKLRLVYRHWLVVDEKVKPFKTLSDIYKEFEIPIDVRASNLINEIHKKNRSVKVLF